MNNDLISRKWLTDAIRNRKTYLSYEDAKDVIDLINNAPTVEAFTENDKVLAYCEGYVRGSHEAYIRPQGEWIYLNKDEPMTVECPFCHERKCCVSNYCDNCGADMRGGNNE